MKSMFTITQGGQPVSVVVSSDDASAIQLTRRLLDLGAGSIEPARHPELMMRARRPTQRESTAFFARQRTWTGSARVAGFLL